MKLGWHYVSIMRPLVKVLNYPRFMAGIIRNRKRRRSSEPLSPEQFFKYGLPSMTEFLSHSKALEQLLHAHRQTGIYLPTSLWIIYDGVTLSIHTPIIWPSIRRGVECFQDASSCDPMHVSD